MTPTHQSPIMRLWLLSAVSAVAIAAPIKVQLSAKNTGECGNAFKSYFWIPVCSMQEIMGGSYYSYQGTYDTRAHTQLPPPPPLPAISAGAPWHADKKNMWPQLRQCHHQCADLRPWPGMRTFIVLVYCRRPPTLEQLLCTSSHGSRNPPLPNTHKYIHEHTHKHTHTHTHTHNITTLNKIKNQI